MLFESVMDTDAVAADIPFDDEEEDEDYCPEKDQECYENDAADEAEFEKEFANMDINDANENEDTSNMIDID